jgi:hypothetical protein
MNNASLDELSIGLDMCHKAASQFITRFSFIDLGFLNKLVCR